jgi:hypothetical protein
LSGNCIAREACENAAMLSAIARLVMATNDMVSWFETAACSSVPLSILDATLDDNR